MPALQALRGRYDRASSGGHVVGASAVTARTRADASPTMVRSEMSSRSNSERAAKIPQTSFQTTRVSPSRRALRQAANRGRPPLLPGGPVLVKGIRAGPGGQERVALQVRRATLYKYFPDVEAVLDVWHERQVQAHLDHVAQVRDSTPGGPDRIMSPS